MSYNRFEHSKSFRNWNEGDTRPSTQREISKQYQTRNNKTFCPKLHLWLMHYFIKAKVRGKLIWNLTRTKEPKYSRLFKEKSWRHLDKLKTFWRKKKMVTTKNFYLKDEEKVKRCTKAFEDLKLSRVLGI